MLKYICEITFRGIKNFRCSDRGALRKMEMEVGTEVPDPIYDPIYIKDYQNMKIILKIFKNRHILQQMCLFCYIVLPNALLSVTMSSLWEIMLSIRVLTVILPVVKVLR